MEVIREATKTFKPFRGINPPSFYICARYRRKDEAKAVALQLQEMGYTITSSWIDQVEDEMLYTDGPEVAGRFAQKDLDEIDRAGTLIYLSEEEDNVWGRGGRHVEFGYALARDKECWIVGPLENLFHYLPGCLQFDSVDDLFAYLGEGV